MFSKKTGAKILFIVIVGSSVALPLIASAYTTPNIWGTPPGFWGPLLSCTGNYLSSVTTGASSLPPCTSLCNLINTFINVIYFAMSIGIFIITPILCVVGGIMVMVSSANPGMLEQAKKLLTGTVIGLALALGAYLIVNTIIHTLNIANVGGFGGSTCTTSS